MRRAPRILLALSLLCFGLAFWWSLGRTRHEVPAAQAQSSVQAANPASESASESASELGGEPSAVDSDLASERVEQQPTSAARELRGVVRMPAGTPSDEIVEILLIGREALADARLRDANDDELAAEPRILARASVDADGRFSIPHRADGEPLWIALRARYAFLSEPRRVRDEDYNVDLLLEPELGAWVTGRVEIASGVEVEGFDVRACELELMFDALALAGGAPPPSGLRAPKTHPRSDGSFEFRGVASRLARELRVSCAQLAAFKGSRFVVEPGLHATIPAVLTRGGSLRGRVVDERGAAIEGAKLVASIDPLMFGQGGFEVREGTSGANGEFRLDAVTEGKVDVAFSGAGVLERTLATSVQRGEVTELGDVALRRGATLSGFLRWPDGRACSDASVRADFDPAALTGMSALNAMQGARGEAKSDAEGRFSIVGLGKGPFVLSASASPADGTPEHRARLGGVTPGNKAYELVLEAPLALAGRVVGPDGRGIVKAQVRAQEDTGAVVRGLGGRSERTETKDESGAFELAELARGNWILTAQAEGYSRSAALKVSLPLEPGASAPSIVLERGGSISGSVLDVGGAPIAGAIVQVKRTLNNVLEQGEEGAAAAQRASSRADGTFTLEGMIAGHHKLVASADGRASSETVEVEVRAGESTGAVVLTLRLGGTLTGEVYGKGGMPAAGAQVLMQQGADPLVQRFANADAEGRFRVEHLAPGTYNVMHFADAGLTSADTGEPDPSELLTGMQLATATIVEGGIAHVVLGAPAKNAVEFSGRVELDGQGVAGIVVTLIPDRAPGAENSAMKFASTDANGGFRATLDGPGSYLVSLQKPGAAGQQQSISQSIDVPEGAAYSHTFELPIGSIAGLVRDSEGAPAVGARVTLSVSGPVKLGTAFGDNYAEVETDSEGRYELVWLAEGSYTVAAGGAPLGGMLGGTARAGRQVREDVRVGRGQRTEGVDFRLQRPGTVTGIVRDPSGAPVSEAAIFVRDGAGHPLERLSMLATDEAGRFTCEGLEPGDYVFSARKGGLASPERGTVQVESSETAKVELALGAGTMLLITVTNEDGSEVEASVTVLDDAGRQVNGLLSLAQLLEDLQAGRLSSREQRVGPLAPGKYRVIVTSTDGRKETKPVTLSGQSERKLNVRL
jgi:hypothetical protein